MNCYLLGLSSNIAPDKYLVEALNELRALGEVIDCSPVLATAPVGTTFRYNFRNQLVIIQSNHPPNILEQKLHHIEVKLGREPRNPVRKDKDRTIDIDILFAADNKESCRQAPLSEQYYQQVQSNWNQTEKV